MKSWVEFINFQMLNVTLQGGRQELEIGVACRGGNVSIKTFWSHFRNILETFWKHFGDNLETFDTFWRHFGDILETFWRHFGDILETFWRHFGDFWRHFGNILVTFWRNFETFSIYGTKVEKMVQPLLHLLHTQHPPCYFDKREREFIIRYRCFK